MKKKIVDFKNFLDVKKIISISKVLCKEYWEKIPFYKSKDSKQNIFLKMCMIIAIVGLSYLSYYIIGAVQKIQYPQMFLNIYLPIMAVIIMFQQILACTNIYYFSKDLEYILPYPIKPIELLLGRFNMLISISYTSILMFLFIPLLLYGMMAATSILYYLGMIIVLITFPIFFGFIISIIMLFIMQLSKLIKNKDLFQFIVTIILMIIFSILEFQAFDMILSNSSEIEQINQGQEINLLEIIENKIKYINNYLVTINPSVNILIGNNIFTNLVELLKIIIINFIACIIFVCVGKQLYLKNILRNIQKINIQRIKKKKENYKYNKINKRKSYIKNEFKEIIKIPAFFMQCVCPIILVVVTVSMIVISMYPSFVAIMQNETVAEQIPELKFDINVLILIVIIFQIIYSFSNLSITAISRKGKNAVFIKYIPISLYKQFLYMNIPQILLNIFISLIILGVAKYLIPQISIIYLIVIFMLGLILNIINSFLMVVVDLHKPNLEWDNETDAIKQNKNKLYQYVLTIIICLIFIYFNQIFEKINLNLAIIIILIILLFILFLINKIIKNKINKLFNKIN